MYILNSYFYRFSWNLWRKSKLKDMWCLQSQKFCLVTWTSCAVWVIHATKLKICLDLSVGHLCFLQGVCQPPHQTGDPRGWPSCCSNFIQYIWTKLQSSFSFQSISSLCPQLYQRSELSWNSAAPSWVLRVWKGKPGCPACGDLSSSCSGVTRIQGVRNYN